MKTQYFQFWWVRSTTWSANWSEIIWYIGFFKKRKKNFVKTKQYFSWLNIIIPGIFRLADIIFLSMENIAPLSGNFPCKDLKYKIYFLSKKYGYMYVISIKKILLNFLVQVFNAFLQWFNTSRTIILSLL